MLTNDIKKGMRIRLRNGWEATMMDNKKGTIRTAEVYGTYTETGSVYAHDIVAVRTDKDEAGSAWTGVEYTESQIKCRDVNAVLFGD
jgi:hypothetical protein